MFRRKMDQLGLEETSWCLDRGGHIDIYPPYTQSLTYTHIYTMTLVPFPHLWHLQPWWRRRKRAKSEEFLTVICVHPFIQPTFIKNRPVTSGIALVLETNRQTRHGVCPWGALQEAAEHLWGALQEAGEQTKSVITTPRDTGKKSSEHRYPRSSGWRCPAMWRGQKSSPRCWSRPALEGWELLDN